MAKKYLDNTGLGTYTTKMKQYVDSKAVTVDSALSSTSENPVQNKVIYAAIGNVESVLAALNSGAGV